MRIFLLCGIMSVAVCAAENQPDSHSSSANDALEASYRADPKNHAIAAALGKRSMENGDWEEAVLWTTKATSLSPETARYHTQLGDAFMLKADAKKLNPLSFRRSIKSAVAAFSKALRLDPELIEARVGRATVLGQIPGWVGGDFDAALQDIAIIRSKNPGKADEILVNCYIKQKNYAKAFATCEDLIAAKPDDPTWPHGYGTIAAESGLQLERAEALLRQYLPNPADPKRKPHYKTHFLLGRILLARGEKEGARREFEACLSLNPSYKKARRILDTIVP